MHQDFQITITIAALSGMLIFGIMIYIIIAVLLINAKRTSKYLNKLSVIEIDHNKKIMETELKVQEQTFDRISREVHDNWAQRLSLISLKLNMMLRTELAASCSRLVNDLQDELRNFSKRMSSSRIKRIGFFNAIEEDLICLKEATGIDYEFNPEIGMSEISEQTSLVLYRIFQEAESNIIRHSEAKSVKVNLRRKENQLIFEIIDDGKGFVADSLNGKGVGLGSIHNRIQMINGECKLTSSPGDGTRIVIHAQL